MSLLIKNVNIRPRIVENNKFFCFQTFFKSNNIFNYSIVSSWLIKALFTF